MQLSLKQLNGIKKFLLAIDIFTSLDEKKVGVVVDVDDANDDADDDDVVVVRILDKLFNVCIDRRCNVFNSL